MDNKDKLKRDFDTLAKAHAPKPAKLKNFILAYFVGGSICIVAQLILNFFVSLGLSREEASSAATIVMILISAALTATGLYQKLGTFAGAGSVVPITGFANSIVAEAIESKKEGMLFGTGSKLFNVAGPVLVYGISTSVIIGILYYLIAG